MNFAEICMDILYPWEIFLFLERERERILYSEAFLRFHSVDDVSIKSCKTDV